VACADSEHACESWSEEKNLEHGGMIPEQDFGCQRAKNKEAELGTIYHLVTAVLLPHLARCDLLQTWPL
jgi:hypothetical protein